MMTCHGWTLTPISREKAMTEAYQLFFKLSLLIGLIFINFAWAATPPHPQPEKAAPDISLIQERGVLRVAFFERNSPPFFMRDPQNNWSGIEIDLAKMIAAELKVKLVIVPAESYDDIIDMVANGKADIGMGLLSITPDRELRITFTDPYYTYQHQLLVNRLQASKNGWSVDQIVTGMQNSKANITIAALEESAQGPILHNLFPNAKIVSYPTLPQAMQAVVDGKAFAALGNSPVEIRDFLQSNPKATLVTEEVVTPNALDLIAAAVPWQYFYLKDWLDLYFDYLKVNGYETKLFQKYNQPVEVVNEFSYPA